jgi:hypothetical protein
MVSLEANQRTCCIKMVSNARKSRGAVLVFRGRVLGAVYGNAGLAGKLFDQEAYARVSADLSERETASDVYIISEPIAIAAAALFHGEFSQPVTARSAVQCFSQFLSSLIESDMPGCVLINDDSGVALLSAYVFRGQLVGLYSGRTGWMQPDAQLAVQEASRYQQATVLSSKLNASSLEEVLGLTFSFSDLVDRTQDGWTEPFQNIDPSLRIRDGDRAELQGLNKGQSSNSLSLNRRSKDALLEREIFLRSEMSHLVNP